METVSKSRRKYGKGLPTIIAKRVKCTPMYVKKVLDDKVGDRDTKTVRRIRSIHAEIEKALQSN